MGIGAASDGWAKHMEETKKTLQDIENSTAITLGSGTIGTALEVGSTGLAIHKACTLGREEQCRKAKYVEGGSLLGSVLGAGAGGFVGGVLVTTACVAIGIPTGGMGTLACGVIGGAVGGWGGGELGESKGERFGEIIYGKMTNE